MRAVRAAFVDSHTAPEMTIPTKQTGLSHEGCAERLKRNVRLYVLRVLKLRDSGYLLVTEKKGFGEDTASHLSTSAPDSTMLFSRWRCAWTKISVWHPCSWQQPGPQIPIFRLHRSQEFSGAEKPTDFYYPSRYLNYMDKRLSSLAPRRAFSCDKKHQK